MAPEGFSVALQRRGADGTPVDPGKVSVSAEGADLRPAAPQPPLKTWTVVPKRGAAEVHLRAEGGGLTADARYKLGPPPARVELALNPATPVKNRDASAELTIRLRRPDGTPAPEFPEPVVQANVGRIEGLTQVDATTYRAKYVLPETQYPEVVVLVAFAPWPHPDSIHGAVGSLLVPLASAIDLPGRTESNAQIAIEIAGVNYGPVQAGSDGRFKLPVVVPPGHRFGKETAVDRVGNRRVTKVDLMLPPTDQLSCVRNPTRVPADGSTHSRVLCATSDPFGKPMTTAQVKLEARRGSVEGPRPIEAGLLEWIYTPPKTLGEADVLAAIWKQGGNVSRDELRIDLAQGPAAKLEVAPAERLVHYGGELALTAEVKDAFDRPRGGASLVVTSSVPGAGSTPVENAPGQLQFTWTPPAAGEAGPAKLDVRAFGPTGKEPAQLGAWIRDGDVYAGVADLAGLPVPGQPLTANETTYTTGADGTVRIGPAVPGKLELRHVRWPGMQRTLYVLSAQAAYPSSTPFGSPVRQLDLQLEPAIPVNIRVQVNGHAVTYWAEDPRGRVLEGRPLVRTLSGGSAGPESTRAGKTTFSVRTNAPITVSIADRATGVTALAEVKP